MLIGALLYGCTAVLAVMSGDDATASPRLASSNGPSDVEAIRAAEETFADSEFWWKRTEAVNAPRLPLAWLGDLIGEFFKLVWKGIEPVFTAIGTFLQDLWYAIRNFFGLPVGLGGYGTGSMLLGAAFLGALGWLAWKVHPVVWQWLKASDRPHIAKKKESIAEQELPEAGALLNQAGEAIQAGKYREALRFAFLSLLACLQNRGQLRYDPSRTNREYLHDLRADPHLTVIFREAARPYERAWYGQRPVTIEEAEHVIGVCKHLVTQDGDT